MIQLESIEQLRKAIERAKAGRLYVQPTSIYRMYRVTNRETGAQYLVNFFIWRGKRFVTCSCKAGQNGKLCKHVAAAAGLHLIIAQERAVVVAAAPPDDSR